MANNETTKPAYIRPAITEAGSLADLTLNAQRPGGDATTSPNTAFGPES